MRTGTRPTCCPSWEGSKRRPDSGGSTFSSTREAPGQTRRGAASRNLAGRTDDSTRDSSLSRRAVMEGPPSHTRHRDDRVQEERRQHLADRPSRIAVVFFKLLDLLVGE